jgi:CheY-like chemotaxis protein
MDNNVQLDKPEVKPEGSQAAETPSEGVAATPVVVPPAPSIAPSVPAVTAPLPPAPPVPSVGVKVDEPKAAVVAEGVAVTATAAGTAAEDVKKADARQRIAFVIEDDFDASQIFGKAMEANGLTFEVINTGNRAIERLNEVAPDIVVLDMHLPNVDGTQILAHIRGTERLAKTVVIVVTADARVGELVKAEADLVVLKPATYTQVRDFASRLLRRHAIS